MKRLVLACALMAPLLAAAFPAGVHHSRIRLGDSVARLVEQGVIDLRKVPAGLAPLLAMPGEQPIVLTRENAAVYATLLWPVGLANRLAANRESPLNGPQLASFASTGGWTLGKAPNGAAYFNRFAIVELSAAQEAVVVRIARQAFRPCCNNSAFFQDCNHGSALLGLLALGARQGLGEEELLREALAFNAFWFAGQYEQTALLFASTRKVKWSDVDPGEVLGERYSSASGWTTNVARELQRRGLVPQGGDSSCGI